MIPDSFSLNSIPPPYYLNPGTRTLKSPCFLFERAAKPDRLYQLVIAKRDVVSWTELFQRPLALRKPSDKRHYRTCNPEMKNTWPESAHRVETERRPRVGQCWAAGE